MDELQLETHENRTTYEPGDVIHGLAGWQLDEAPASVELRLTWYTEGKGDRDVSVVQRETFGDPPAVDARVFEVTLPPAPWSFSGKLITLRWALELIVDRRSTRLDLVVAPGGEEIDILNTFPE